MSSLLRTSLLIALVCLWLCVGHASATNVFVDCTGSNHSAFHTINDAINTLDQVGPHLVTVHGTCKENVVIGQRDRLTIQGQGGYATIENAADPAYITLLIYGSRNITLDHLIIQGGSQGLYVTHSSSAVILQNSIVQNSQADGIDLDMASMLHLENCTIQNNAGTGIALSNSSHLLLGTYPDQRIRISGNGCNGIDVDGSDIQLNYGVLTVENNGSAGINMNGGRLQFYGGSATNPAVIQNNHTGINLNAAASATFWGGLHIRNNGDTGINANGGSSMVFWQTTDDQGKTAFTTIDGHTTVGISLNQSSSAQIIGAHVIRSNGSLTADPGSRGGITMEGASLTIGWNTLIKNNVGPGVRLGVKSDLIMFDMTVSNNTEEGLLETNLSGGGFYNPVTFTGNGHAPVSCDNMSVAFGDAATIPGIACANISKAASERPAIHMPKLR
jgi:parallel beta-helix repeat protein